MDLETLLTGTKWEIIELIAENPSSSTELAKDLKTTVANISQQVRLLETAGLVNKKKTGSGKPGKPRVLFSLSHDFAFITIFTKGYSEKRLIKIDNKQREVLKKVLEE